LRGHCTGSWGETLRFYNFNKKYFEVEKNYAAIICSFEVLESTSKLQINRNVALLYMEIFCIEVAKSPPAIPCTYFDENS